MSGEIRTVSILGGIANAYLPSRENVLGLKVGDRAPDCFGRLSTVTRIFAQVINEKGSAYVCYYVDSGAGGSISDGMVEDCLHRDLATTRMATSARLDWEERRCLNELR